MKSSPVAELVLTHGQIITMDPRRPKATAMAIAGGKILHVGTPSEIEPLIRKGTTQVIPLEGKTVIPGFVESHGHLLGMGRMNQQINLGELSGVDQVVERLKAVVEKTPAGTWIYGRGWDQNRWDHPVFPDHHPLTQTAPGHPVVFTRVDGHASWVNQKAMEIAGLNSRTVDPAGGQIHRDSHGQPTGILIDNAMDLVTHVQPPRDREQERAALKMGLAECLRHGITSFHDACSPSLSLELYREFLAKDELTVRLYAMIDGNDRHLREEFLLGGPQYWDPSHRLNVSSIKLYADGALGSCGAALHAEYCHRPGNCGLLLLPEEEIWQVTQAALKKGVQVCTHAIGDRANTLVLNAYEKALEELPMALQKKARLRVEHAELLRPEDVPRFSRKGIIASMQATHCTSDMPWIEERLGTGRARQLASLWRSLLDSGAIIANGSDAPIESVNPLWGFYSSISRKDHQGEPPGGWNPEQRMTREEALRSFTLHGAYAGFAEEITGSLTAGKEADAVVLSHNILEGEEKDILDTRVLMTIMGGKILYRV